MAQHSLDRILRRVNSVPFHPTNNPGSEYQGSGWPLKPTPAIKGPWACPQRIPPPWTQYMNLFSHLFKRMCGFDIPLCKLQVKYLCYVYSQDRQCFPRFFAWVIIDGPYQRDRRQRALLQHQNFNFLSYLGWYGCFTQSKVHYNEGCAKLNYLLPEV